MDMQQCIREVNSSEIWKILTVVYETRMRPLGRLLLVDTVKAISRASEGPRDRRRPSSFRGIGLGR